MGDGGDLTLERNKNISYWFDTVKAYNEKVTYRILEGVKTAEVKWGWVILSC